MTAATPLRGSPAVDTFLMAGRLLTRWRRQPMVPVAALLFPIVLLITTKLLIGKSILNLTGTNSLYGLVPASAVIGAFFGAIGAGYALPVERESGLLSRLWVLPVHRGSALAGRLLAEAARTLAGTAVITATGVALGLRFDAGVLAVIAFLLLPTLLTVGFSTAVISIAVRADGRLLVTWLGAGSGVFLFFNTGVAPVQMFPTRLRPLVQLQPMSPTIEAMRAFAEGGPVLWPLVQTFTWVVGLIVVFGPVAVHGYRVAAEAGS